MSSAAKPSPRQVLERLQWTVLKRLDGLLQGDYRSLWRGSGLDLAELREYQHGDDVRHIDWNVTARLQQPHVRQYREDREVAAWFLLDLTASIDFGSDTRSKLDVAEELLACLASLLGRHGNPVGGVFYRPASFAHAPVLPPRTGRAQVLQLMSRLRAVAAQPARTQARGAMASAAGPAGAAGTQPPGETRLAELVAMADAVIRRRSIVFVLSDFISAPGWQEALGRLALRHDVMVLRLTDPADRALPPVGLVTVQDAETGEQLLVDTADPAFLARFQALAAAHEDALLEGLAHAGVDALEVGTEADLLATLLRFVALRRQRLVAAPSQQMRAESATDFAADSAADAPTAPVAAR